ncbi:hypothetical protein Tsubulata_018581 [Turnera subulata]|uniref:RING-type E3 ubiquitin transferase n=1 Tax=Turnera subulata TaxID=218843 RepID=A0A9Q0G402_9ROSI|nr:hypothetical protein Tsubulata_018581 [Turnera subulata]
MEEHHPSCIDYYTDVHLIPQYPTVPFASSPIILAYKFQNPNDPRTVLAESRLCRCVIEDGLDCLYRELSGALIELITDLNRSHRDALLQEIMVGVMNGLSHWKSSAPPNSCPEPILYIEVSVKREEASLAERFAMELSEEDWRMVPTARAAQVVKGVKVAAGEEDRCAVCLEDVVGCAGRLPCDHVFHRDCIMKWLDTSHYCPVCRYELPTEN